MDVAFAIDRNYAPHFCVALTSLLENNNDIINRIFLIYNGLEVKDREVLSSFFARKYNKSINFVEIGNEADELFTSGHIKAAAYFRIFLPRLLPEDVEEVLYLDSDLIVVGSLAEIKSIKYNGDMCLSAVAHSWTKKYKKERYKVLGLDIESEYFNSGVMHISLKIWRATNLIQRALALESVLHEKLESHDQDLLNVLFEKQWNELPKKFNMYNAVVNMRCATDIEGAREAQKDPRIIHFIGKIKPWHYIHCHKFKKEWKKYLRITPYSGHCFSQPSFNSTMSYLIPNSIKYGLKKMLLNRQN